MMSPLRRAQVAIRQATTAGVERFSWVALDAAELP